MANLSIHPLIKSCLFLSCTSGDDGGGCGIYYSQSSLLYAVDSCRCIKCKGIASPNNEGGGMCLSGNDNFISCTNCLLYACEAPSNAGGIFLDCNYATNEKKITFCFFTENKSDGAIDVCVWRQSQNFVPLSHCFTTSTGKTVGEYENTKDHSDWLPHGYIIFLFIYG